MPNILDGLAPDLYKAAEIVGRQLVGFIPACTVNGDGSQRAAVGQSVSSAFTRPAVIVDTQPSMTIPEGNDQTIDKKQLFITKSRGAEIPWTGEEQGTINSGAGFSTVYGNQFVQAIRGLVNEIEADLNVEAYTNASRAVGTAGTTPFGTTDDLVVDGREVLVENGMPMDDGQATLILNLKAGSNMRKLSELTKVNESGTPTLLRQGILGDLQGFMVRESAQIRVHTPGTGTGYLVNGAGAVDAKTLQVDGGTPGATGLLPGDVIQFAGDTENSYVVNPTTYQTDTAGPAGLTVGAGTLNLGGGLIEGIADNAAITSGAAYRPNVMMHRAALELAIRAPATPVSPDGTPMDAAVDNMIIQDPFSGLAFDVSVYPGYKKMMINISAAWGKKAWLPEFIAVVQG